jgi:flagellar protein FliO/FliZ
LDYLSYFLNLALMLALVAGLAVLSLWLYKRFQPGLGFGKRETSVRLIDVLPMGATAKLAVVEFANKRILLSVARGRVDKLAETDAPLFIVPDDDQ